MTGIFFLIAAAVAYWFIAPRWAAFQQRKQFAVDLANVRLIQGPRLIASEWEGDATVEQRAATLRGLLAMSGNTWITTEQIVVRVYHPHSGSKTLLTFDKWRSLVQQEFDAICFQHYQNTAVKHDGQFANHINGQYNGTAAH